MWPPAGILRDDYIDFLLKRSRDEVWALTLIEGLNSSIIDTDDLYQYILSTIDQAEGFLC